LLYAGWDHLPYLRCINNQFGEKSYFIIGREVDNSPHDWMYLFNRYILKRVNRLDIDYTDNEGIAFYPFCGAACGYLWFWV